MQIGTIKCLLCGGDQIYPGPRYQNHLIYEHGVVHNVENLIKISIHKRDHNGQLPDFIENSPKFAKKDENNRQIKEEKSDQAKPEIKSKTFKTRDIFSSVKKQYPDVDIGPLQNSSNTCLHILYKSLTWRKIIQD